MLAYLIFLLVIAWSWRAGKKNQSNLFNRLKKWPLILVTMQVVLGIFTVLESTSVGAAKFGLFGWLAVLHQLTGMLLLLLVLALYYLQKPVEKPGK
jgi:cytochrome c oxidase assembly protein subunit 15